MEVAVDPGRPRRVVVNGSAPISRIVDVVEAANPALAERLLSHLKANVRLLRVDELEEDPLDEELADTVSQLEQTAARLSAQVGTTRARVAPLLEKEAAEACSRLTAHASEEAKQAIAKLATRKRPASAIDDLESSERAGKILHCISNAKDPEELCDRMEKLREAAADTRKRAENALDVLRIIADSSSGGDEENNTVTISINGDQLTLPLSPSEPFDDDGPGSESIPIPVSPDARSNRRASRASLPGDPAVSPHITPRSKTRRRLLGSPAASKSNLPR